MKKLLTVTAVSAVLLPSIAAASASASSTPTAIPYAYPTVKQEIPIARPSVPTANADLISSNRDAVDKNTNDIKDLRSDFKEMGKRVDGTAAMGMATSSLFQPYGIGKANVTVGLGNYNGANTVAFGSGIRIDEHVALRANVAYVDSTNDTGFGVGASYEW